MQWWKRWWTQEGDDGVALRGHQGGADGVSGVSPWKKCRPPSKIPGSATVLFCFYQSAPASDSYPPTLTLMQGSASCADFFVFLLLAGLSAASLTLDGRPRFDTLNNTEEQNSCTEHLAHQLEFVKWWPWSCCWYSSHTLMTVISTKWKKRLWYHFFIQANQRINQVNSAHVFVEHSWHN